VNVSALSSRAIEWRHAWPVRFAHHPLCTRHRNETWRIGRMYLCRGCVSLAVGLTVGTAAVFTVEAVSSAWLALALAPIVLALSWPTWYPRLPRTVRDLLRGALGLLIVCTSHAVFSAPPKLWPVVPVFIAIWWLYRRTRARVQRSRCDGCPELGRGVCSGYQLHAQAMRAIALELEARMEADLSAPGCPEDWQESLTGNPSQTEVRRAP
jgi:hypothetical protein